LIIAIVIFTTMMMIQQWQRVDKINWNEFVYHVQNKHIISVLVKDTEVTGKFNEQGMADRGEKASVSFVVYYKPDVHGEWLGELLKRMEQDGVQEDADRPRVWLILLIQWVLPLVILVGFFYFIFARNLRSGAGGMLMSFGRSKHRLQGKDRVKVTFKDVAGVEEAKEEVAEIIEFLKNPKKFQRLGGRIPRGVLLVGPPGCRRGGLTSPRPLPPGQGKFTLYYLSGRGGRYRPKTRRGLRRRRTRRARADAQRHIG
jgi:cell division protease FtsH